MSVFYMLPGRGLALALALGAAAVAIPGDAAALSKKDRRTLVGAVVGGLGGALVSNGDPWATVGGALAGGTIGNVTAEDRARNQRWERDRRERERHWNRGGDRRDWGRYDHRDPPRRYGR